jgi:hypothetical protein
VRQTDPAYLDMIRTLPCVICGRGAPNHAAHVRYGSEEHGKPLTGMGIRPDDKWTLPLCHKHHITGQHLSGERLWWAEQSIDPIRLCVTLRDAYEKGIKSGLSLSQLRDDMILVIGLGWLHG